MGSTGDARSGRPAKSGYPDLPMSSSSDTNVPVVSCRGIGKRFGHVVAVDDLSLDVVRGEVLSLLGPSGCGKTTLLRLIAGLERPDAGTILLDGVEVSGRRAFAPPERRQVGVVFQDYALFPHMTVARNVAYGLTLPAKEREERVESQLELVGLSGMGGRRPHELSGGQRQRVAIARALAPSPKILLLDEPFSNLDAALRARVRVEVCDILRAAGATSVFVTHDQEEALSLADRVAVMVAGHLHQVASPDQLYAYPADPVVAGFVGEADVLAGDSDGSSITCPVGVVVPRTPVRSGAVDVVLRPENVRLRLDGSGGATVVRSTYFGHDQLVEVLVDAGPGLRSRMGPGTIFHAGDRVSVTVVGAVTAFPAGS